MGDGEKVDTVDRDISTSARLSGASAWRAHVTLLLGLALCVAAFWFELGRALGGNSLSWAYVFEWPLLGAFAVYMWWKVIHPEQVSSGPRTDKPAKSIGPEFEGMLSAWQQHQEELNRFRQSESKTPIDEP
ncbi:MAG: hypothetical protein HKL86_11010 [Acidimicrobiaceae bacterium]|nr:hypothetical protein [Acidimicrobiaceae bacterium]